MGDAVTPAGCLLLRQFESCRLTAYLDTAGVPTIGWGTTHYPDGSAVRLGETCTPAQADDWFDRDVDAAEIAVRQMTTPLSLFQLDALTSFAYNEGVGAYRGSHLHLAVNANPSNPAIRDEFMKWYFADHQPSLGLWRRRHAEADHYFQVATLCPPMPDHNPPLTAA